MEDEVHAVFKSEPNQVVYKQILTYFEAIELNELFLNSNSYWQDGAIKISTGLRPYIDVNLEDKDVKLVYDRLIIVLKDYFPDIKVSTDARFYNHQFGGTKPHKDGNRDGVSNYTLLLYLTDNFDDGKLSIKTKRSEEERLECNSDKFHKIFTITPKIGYGVIFNKNLTHWAADVLEGNKNFLLIHLYSDF